MPRLVRCLRVKAVDASGEWKGRIVTELVPFKEFIKLGGIASGWCDGDDYTEDGKGEEHMSDPTILVQDTSNLILQKGII